MYIFTFINTKGAHSQINAGFSLLPPFFFPSLALSSLLTSPSLEAFKEKAGVALRDSVGTAGAEQMGDIRGLIQPQWFYASARVPSPAWVHNLAIAAPCAWHSWGNILSGDKLRGFASNTR